MTLKNTYKNKVSKNNQKLVKANIYKLNNRLLITLNFYRFYKVWTVKSKIFINM